MFRIRRIHDDALPVNREAIGQVKQILKDQFAEAPKRDIDGLTQKLRDPFAQRFRAILHVAERNDGQVLGFALVLHVPELRMAFLDYIASSVRLTSRGIGGALYQRVREEAVEAGVRAIFFECLPDEAADCGDQSQLAANRARLRFYENYGARPAINNEYNAQLEEGDNECMPYIVIDDLAPQRPLRRRYVRDAVRAILERKYAHLCPPQYVEKVVASFKEEPVTLRAPRYVKAEKVVVESVAPGVVAEKIALFVNDKHDIHHVHDRGYVEAPVRVATIMAELDKTSHLRTAARPHPLAGSGRGGARPGPRGLPAQGVPGPAGGRIGVPVRVSDPQHQPRRRTTWPCAPATTASTPSRPLNRNAFLAARGAVDCALTAADALLAGTAARLRPGATAGPSRRAPGLRWLLLLQQRRDRRPLPGAATARWRFSTSTTTTATGSRTSSTTADDVLTVSIHGNPRFAYPYFSGFADEQGAGAGLGYNLNLPLPEKVDGAALPPGPGAGAAAHRAASVRLFWSWPWASTRPRATPPAPGP